MPISDIPLFSMLRTRMQWAQERQNVLSENVANADTPKFRPRDLTPPKFNQPGVPQPGPLVLVRTSANHIAGGVGGDPQFQSRAGGSEVRPAGNAVSLEDEMIKVASNQMDFQAATALYARGLGLLKTALGKRS
jgi:flagellar basal-body rod protein FlgB